MCSLCMPRPPGVIACQRLLAAQECLAIVSSRTSALGGASALSPAAAFALFG